MENLAQQISALPPGKRKLFIQRLKEAGIDVSSLLEMPRRPEASSYALSFAQERLWFLDQLEPESALYNISTSIRLVGHLNVRALHQSLDEIVRRHEVLRTTFAVIDEQPVQIIRAPFALARTYIDIQSLSLVDQETEIPRLAVSEAQYPFNLQQGPLLRPTLLCLNKTTHILLLIVHHIAFDGWSSQIFLQELADLYTAYVTGQPVTLPELEVQYADFALWQRERLQGILLEEHFNYWQQQMAGAPAVLELPTDRPRPPIQTFQGTYITFEVDSHTFADLRHLCQHINVTLFMALLAVFKMLLMYYTGREDIIVGIPIANRIHTAIEPLIGFFTNTLVLRTDLADDPSFQELLLRVKEVTLAAYTHQEVPFELLVERLKPPRDMSRNPLIQTFFMFQNTTTQSFQLPELMLMASEVDSGNAKFDLTLSFEQTSEKLLGSFEYNTDLFNEATIQRMGKQYHHLLTQVLAHPERPLSHISVITQIEGELLQSWNNTRHLYAHNLCIHYAFEKSVLQTPDAIALVFEDVQLSYSELNRRTNQLAHYLRSLGVGPEVPVGLCVERSIETIVGMLGILKAGGAYVPLDPNYPLERLNFMVQDARLTVLLTLQRSKAGVSIQIPHIVLLDNDWPRIAHESVANPLSSMTSDTMAYIIYTSGSTGKAKGVVIQHRSVMNFFEAMNQSIACQPSDRMLAITSISFDISVLELLWPLTRGSCVILLNDEAMIGGNAETRDTTNQRPLDFSLFFFANEVAEHDEKYRLLIESARFADTNGFTAIWTPERHFHEFGGIYANPSISAAALAMVTQRIQIRAGSVVLPLHHPVRVAEEWAMIDNLSRGRVGISFASGWHANDFVFAPEAYQDRKAIMFRDIETVQKLWEGQTVTFLSGKGTEIPVRIFPRPIQPELPVWITSGGDPDTFTKAGKMGANVLTHLLGQSIEAVGEKIALYRNSLEEHGHDPRAGRVTLMLHAFIGEDLAVIKQQVRDPFINYLRSSFGLVATLAKSLGYQAELGALTAQDQDEMLSFAFERYFTTAALIGTPDTCMALIEHLKSIGVDEIACLIDFGVETNTVLNSLPLLNQVYKRANEHHSKANYSLHAVAATQQISLMQCTPSTISLLLQSQEAMDSLHSVRTFMLGGEALSSTLAAQLQRLLPANMYNMYGPTETTIWSAVHPIEDVETTIPLGQPIANTQIFILDQHLRQQPIGVPGELYIGGDGLARGYLFQPVLTADRFIPDPFSSMPGARIYRTGDLARYLPDGSLEFLGRVDHQVKLRGYRIELGEIEMTLRLHPHIREAVVLVREDRPGDQRLVGYIVPMSTTLPSLAAEMRRFLQAYLPEYMIPVTYIVLETLPLTPNGKIDRRAFPAPNLSVNVTTETFVAPRNSIEELLIDIWQEILGVPSLGIYDNFFEIGGHSLLAMQLIVRIRDVFQIQLPLRSLFQSPTVAGLAEIIGQSYGHQEDDAETSQLLEELVQLSEAEVNTLLAENPAMENV